MTAAEEPYRETVVLLRVRVFSDLADETPAVAIADLLVREWEGTAVRGRPSSTHTVDEVEVTGVEE